jgi:phosphate starvation-inducible protein PhoH and related proteins
MERSKPLQKSFYKSKQPNMVKKIRVEAIEPQTETQKKLVRAIESFPVTLVKGPAGTGKTFVAVATIASLFSSDSSYKQIVVSRPNISTGKTLGSFPGTPEEKLESWLSPVLSNLREIYGKGHVEGLIRSGSLVLQPIETIRGQSYENSLVLIDEAQNLTKNELIAVMTRLGSNSKMILTGDPDQTDCHDGGYEWLTEFVREYNLPAEVIQFQIEDIVRSGFVGAFVKALAISNKKKKRF